MAEGCTLGRPEDASRRSLRHKTHKVLQESEDTGFEIYDSEMSCITWQVLYTTTTGGVILKIQKT